MTIEKENDPAAAATANGASDSTNHQEEGTMKLNTRLTDAIRGWRDNKPWARRLDAVLRKHGITDTEFADIIGKSPRVARSLRTGRRTIPIGVIAEIARHLQVSVLVVLAELEDIDLDSNQIQRPIEYCAEPQHDGVGGGL